jgi:hypothetical protein
MITFKRLFLLTFLLLLLLPALQQAFGFIRVDKVNEHREKVAWPAGNLLAGPVTDKGYTTKVEAYFADNFPLRDLLLRVHGQLEYSLLGVAREVIVGRDGWLSDKKILAEHLHQLDQVDEVQIQAGVLQLKRLQYWLEQRGVRFLMVVVPVKPTVYPEQYPAKYKRRTERLGLEKFQEALALNTIPFVDVHREMKKHKGGENLYYRTDMHWNSVGVTRTAQAIVDRLSTDILGRAIWAEDMKRVQEPYYGEELRSIPLLFPRREVTPVWASRSASPLKEVPEPTLEVFRPADTRRALLPPSIMFGNSFMLAYPTVGYHNYFVESSRVLDYQFFMKALDYVKPHHKIFVLHLYETQLQYHVMPTGRAKAWSGFAQYWDKRIENLPLPPGYAYRPAPP